MADKSSLTGKYAIVTGSTQGLGEAIARLFVERGAAGLIICGRNGERGMTVAADLNSDTCQVHFVQADLADVEDCRRIVAAADQHFGTVHILVKDRLSISAVCRPMAVSLFSWRMLLQKAR